MNRFKRFVYRRLPLFIKSEIINSPFVSVETLKLFSTDEDWLVRYWVARHPSTSVEALKELAFDKEIDIRWLATVHPNATEEVIILARARSYVLTNFDPYYSQLYSYLTEPRRFTL